MSGGHELDPEALGDHIDRMYRAAWGMCGNREDAEDLVQETFALVLRRRRWIRSSDDLGYLLTALRHAFVGSRRQASRRPWQTELPDEIDASGAGTATPQQHLQTIMLYEEIAQLPSDQRDAVVAVDVVGLSYREAARALRVREATLTTRLHRGRKRLAEALELD